MKYGLFLLLFCVNMAFGAINEIEVGDFVAKAVLTKDGKSSEKLQFFNKKSGKLIDEWDWSCESVPYFLGGIDDNDSNYSIVTYACINGYTPETFYYDKKTGGFWSSEFTFKANANEMLETKEHFIIASYHFEDLRNENWSSPMTLTIFEKPSRKFIQRTYVNASRCSVITSDMDEQPINKECLRKGDYNFDGIDDFSVSQGYYRYDYFLYDPKKKEFFDSDFEEYGYLEFDEKTKTISAVCCDDDGVYNNSTYKVVNNKLVLQKKHCYAYTDDDTIEYDCNNGKSPPYFFDIYNLTLKSIGLKKNFELYMLYDDYIKKYSYVLYKGQKEFIDLKFNKRDGNQLVYDEIYKGNFKGRFILHIDRNDSSGFSGATYIRKDGKEFEFEVTY